jgi:hypothetical protein
MIFDVEIIRSEKFFRLKIVAAFILCYQEPLNSAFNDDLIRFETKIYIVITIIIIIIIIIII